MTGRAIALRYEQLSGLQKAAIVMMTLGPETAGRVGAELSADELEALSLQIAHMESVPGDWVARVLSEWRDLAGAPAPPAAGGLDYARQVLDRAVGGPETSDIKNRIAVQLEESNGFRNLRAAHPAEIASRIRGEHPQTIAVLLAQLDPAQSAAVLAELAEDQSAEVVYRLARVERIAPEVMEVLRATYGSGSSWDGARGASVQGGPAAVAAVLNRMRLAREQGLLEHIARRDRHMAEEIRNLMFVFEDLIKLDDRALQRLLRDVQTKELALALKSSSEELKERIFSLLSNRAADVLREEMEFLGLVRAREVEIAQANVIKLLRALEDTGEIAPADDTDMVSGYEGRS